MTDTERKTAAKKFAERWEDADYEIGQSQKFWIDLISSVYGETDIGFIEFEKRVMVDGTMHRIDAFIGATRVLIEHKGGRVDLLAPQPREGNKTPYEQALNYIKGLSVNNSPKWIITCNFKEFYLYDMQQPASERVPDHFFLKDLGDEYKKLSILVNEKNETIEKEYALSWEAGRLIGNLYRELLKCYPNPKNESTKKALNILCVRLVFCLYAEDAGLFNEYYQFKSFVSNISPEYLHLALKELFAALNTKERERKNVSARAAAFPYVNGGLFEGDIEIPVFSNTAVEILLENASFDWSEISPTIFGALFESTLNPDTRDENGMHFTSLEDIHKVIDPLFLDDLNAELAEIKEIKVKKTKEARIEAFREKLASFTFLDPACGSGNFLTETYLSLRKLENEALKLQYLKQLVMPERAEIKVSIGQFYGIEINDFAVTVAKTALWIAESQMMKATEEIVHQNLNFLPLKSYANIIEGNALRLDWSSIVPKGELNYIIGNPPFKGQQLRTREQSADMINLFGRGSAETKLDYVLCWYKKALDLINSTPDHDIRAAFVSTNSICQGESVPTFWKRMSDEGLQIIFAHQSFKWNNKSNQRAEVICIVVGFTNQNYSGEKYLFSEGEKRVVKHINAYLHDAPDIWITGRSNVPPASMPKMVKGSEPTDGGKLFLTQKERSALIKKYPILSKYIKPFVGGDEYVSNRAGVFTRFCFWFLDANPSDYANIHEIKERLAKIIESRQNSSADRIRRKAAVPQLFCQIRQPQNDYLLFPQHSSGERKYIPIGFMPRDVIVGNACYIISNASLYLFGVLTSEIHMAWVRLVCGRIGNGYRYSPAIYNNFPFPKPTKAQKRKIEKTAQQILDAREKYSDSPLIDLYGSQMFLYPELQNAHQENDKAVAEAYGFKYNMTESEILAALMKQYRKLASMQ